MNERKEPLAVIILAAGLGKRMKTDLPKVLTSTREKPMLWHVLDAVRPLAPSLTIIVTGHKRELVEESVGKYRRNSHSEGLGEVRFAFQEKQLGTGHAVKCALPALEGFSGQVMILYGDVPLLRDSSLQEFLAHHTETNSTLSVLSAVASDPFNYGRIVRSQDSKFIEKIVEHKDCSEEQLKIKEINSGIYVVDSVFLAPAVEGLTNENAQNEYYLTDIVETASKEGQRVTGFVLEDFEETLGVNSPKQLADINRILNNRNIERLLTEGVLIEDPASTYVDSSVQVGAGTRIGPNVQLKGNTTIGKGVFFEGTALIKDSVIEDGVTIRLSVRAEEAIVRQGAKIGPFAHLRPQSDIGEEAKIGNFVETKNAKLSKKVSAGHLTYLGDCEVGEATNIGAGTITCNYDGYAKHRTVIKAHVKIGSNTSLVAPITIGEKATIGAGSTITKDVSPEALAVTRVPQVEREGYYQKKKKLQE